MNAGTGRMSSMANLIPKDLSGSRRPKPALVVKLGTIHDVAGSQADQCNACREPGMPVTPEPQPQIFDAAAVATSVFTPPRVRDPSTGTFAGPRAWLWT
jgi:hypothetical protein